MAEKLGDFTERTSSSLTMQTYKFFIMIKKYIFMVYFSVGFLKI